jgi:hypothetical protein
MITIMVVEIVVMMLVNWIHPSITDARKNSNRGDSPTDIFFVIIIETKTYLFFSSYRSIIVIKKNVLYN